LIGPPAAMPFTLNVPVVAPAEITTLAGETVTMDVLALLRETVTADAGAGETVIVPTMVRPTPTRPPVVIAIVFVLVTLNALLVAPERPVALAVSE
jgi:hypothetical protein